MHPLNALFPISIVYLGMLTLFNDSQNANVPSSIIFTLLGIINDSRFEHPANAFLPIFTIPSCKIISFNNLLLANPFSGISFIERGIWIVSFVPNCSEKVDEIESVIWI